MDHLSVSQNFKLTTYCKYTVTQRAKSISIFLLGSIIISDCGWHQKECQTVKDGSSRKLWYFKGRPVRARPSPKRHQIRSVDDAAQSTEQRQLNHPRNDMLRKGTDIGTLQIPRIIILVMIVHGVRRHGQSVFLLNTWSRDTILCAITTISLSTNCSLHRGWHQNDVCSPCLAERAAHPFVLFLLRFMC